MADNNKTVLDVSESDFFALKAKLIAFYKNKPQFSDYNYDGSAINFMLDGLAYAAHMTAMQSNLTFSEGFLDSAVQRGAVVSRAKEIGYTPKSPSAAKALIRISFAVTGSPSQFVLPKNTKFSAVADNTTYTFVTVQDYIINNVNGLYTADIEIYQGNFATYTYTVDLDDASQRFIIPTPQVDTTFLTVLYKNSSTTVNFAQFSYVKDLNLYELKSDTQVYFLQESFDGYFEVYFGDGIIGQAMQNGNVVQLNYLITNGSAGNNARTFTIASTISGISNISVITLDPANGGGDIETTDSIKYLAPFYYQAQDRAVTEDDYKAIIGNNYSDIDDVAVWGGEKNVPPAFGKVFIAIKPKASSYFSNTIKQTIQNDIISRFNIVGIIPEIVDPDYTEVSVSTVATYNARLYNTASNIDLDSAIRVNITSFFTNDANKFNQSLSFSKLVGIIDNTSSLITNSITNLTLSKSVEIFPGISGLYTFNFNNSLYPGALVSNLFVVDGVTWYIKDVPTPGTSVGVLVVCRTTDAGATIYLSTNTGTINYNTGTITLNNIRIDSIVNDPIFKRLVISVAPGPFINVASPTQVYTDNNVYTNGRDQIITLADAGISLILIPDDSV